MYEIGNISEQEIAALCVVKKKCVTCCGSNCVRYIRSNVGEKEVLALDVQEEHVSEDNVTALVVVEVTEM